MTGLFYFEDRCGGEFQRHGTEAEALAVADETLAVYRRESGRDGEWPLDVEDVTVGRIESGAGPDGDDAKVATHRATAEGNEADGYDYAMRPVEPPHRPAP